MSSKNPRCEIPVKFCRGASRRLQVVSNTQQNTWERYTQAWRAPTALEKTQALRPVLSAQCEYSDPLTSTRGQQALVDYIYRKYPRSKIDVPACALAYFALEILNPRVSCTPPQCLFKENRPLTPTQNCIRISKPSRSTSSATLFSTSWPSREARSNGRFCVRRLASSKSIHTGIRPGS